MRRALIPGTFDPPTKGHLWLVETARKLFEHGVTILVAVNASKHARSGALDVQSLWIDILDDLEWIDVSVQAIEHRFVADVAEQRDSVIVRGARNAADFSYEAALADFNRERAGVETVILVPPRHLESVSSTLVRSIVGLDGWEDEARKYVPERVIPWLDARTPLR